MPKKKNSAAITLFQRDQAAKDRLSETSNYNEESKNEELGNINASTTFEGVAGQRKKQRMLHSANCSSNKLKRKGHRLHIPSTNTYLSLNSTWRLPNGQRTVLKTRQHDRNPSETMEKFWGQVIDPETLLNPDTMGERSEHSGSEVSLVCYTQLCYYILTGFTKVEVVILSNESVYKEGEESSKGDVEGAAISLFPDTSDGEQEGK
ncbi:MAG: hypothetical protein LQ338_004793 [Usnochroma carphineum]|nr:MAG: hypothetical protein LQ338_004793 [Usnochroma carphineum]